MTRNVYRPHALWTVLSLNVLSLNEYRNTVNTFMKKNTAQATDTHKYKKINILFKILYNIIIQKVYRYACKELFKHVTQNVIHL